MVAKKKERDPCFVCGSNQPFGWHWAEDPANRRNDRATLCHNHYRSLVAKLVRGTQHQMRRRGFAAVV